ncbi:MAG: endonuclease/exonuclease/phosphatase family protein [Candidatus Aenigmarchaeota archaeon]|nr:endonuclease/exonuclease/phosphatase family protein [Candidatus Aenigmarchaeota archaeon]
MHSLKLLSYNVLADHKGVIERYKDPLVAWKYRKEKVFSVIKKAKADVFGLQEFTADNLGQFSRAFGGDYNIIAYPESHEPYWGIINVLAVSPRITVEEQGWGKIEDNGTAMKGNNLWSTYVWARVVVGEKRLILICTHLDPTMDQKHKKKEGAALMGLLKKQFPEQYKDGIILFGDMNTDILPGRNVDVAGCGKELSKYFIDAAGHFGNKQPTHANWLGWAQSPQIDHFFVSPGLKPFLKNYSVMNSTYKRKDGKEQSPSDHFPIQLELGFP